MFKNQKYKEIKWLEFKIEYKDPNGLVQMLWRNSFDLNIYSYAEGPKLKDLYLKCVMKSPFMELAEYSSLPEFWRRN